MPKDGGGRRAAPPSTVGRPQQREQGTRHVPDRRQYVSNSAAQGEDRGAESHSAAVRGAVSKASRPAERAADDAVAAVDASHGGAGAAAQIRGCHPPRRFFQTSGLPRCGMCRQTLLTFRGQGARPTDSKCVRTVRYRGTPGISPRAARINAAARRVPDSAFGGLLGAALVPPTGGCTRGPRQRAPARRVTNEQRAGARAGGRAAPPPRFPRTAGPLRRGCCCAERW